jgi:hypothetical protein
MANPIQGIGLLARGPAPSGELAGTCFALRHSRYFLTAAHCVKDAMPSDFRIMPMFQASLDFLRVDRIHRHLTADVAVLEVSVSEDVRIPAFWNSVGNYHYGEDVMAFGFPEDVFGPDAKGATARMFRGYIQRTFFHTSHLGYRYEAAELNFGAPGGLSGGPVFRPGAPQMLIGLVTENFQSTTFLEAVEETEVNGSRTRSQYQTVINYGVALLLDRVADWISTIIPPRDSLFI